jgi:hypothetical protein
MARGGVPTTARKPGDGPIAAPLEEAAQKQELAKAKVAAAAIPEAKPSKPAAKPPAAKAKPAKKSTKEDDDE